MVGMALLGELLSSITLKIFFNLYSSKSLWDILGVVLPFSGRPLSAKKFVFFPSHDLCSCPSQANEENSPNSSCRAQSESCAREAGVCAGTEAP